MLKMQVDPDDLLKTKGNEKSKRIDLDGCLKTKELCENRGEAGMLLKRKAVIALFRPDCMSSRAPHRRNRATSTTYSGQCSTVVDPENHTHILCNGALARLTSVTEDLEGLARFSHYV